MRLHIALVLLVGIAHQAVSASLPAVRPQNVSRRGAVSQA